MLLTKLFGVPDSPGTRFEDSDEALDLRSALLDLVREQLARGGISEKCVEIKLREGSDDRHRPTFTVMLRLVRWERRSALRLLVGLPILDARLRQAVKSSWLAQACNLAGIWLHASSAVQEKSALLDLRTSLLELEDMRRDPDSGAMSHGMWSVPTDLGSLGSSEPMPLSGK